jgi:hypothetical protein
MSFLICLAVRYERALWKIRILFFMGMFYGDVQKRRRNFAIFIACGFTKLKEQIAHEQTRM